MEHGNFTRQSIKSGYRLTQPYRLDFSPGRDITATFATAREYGEFQGKSFWTDITQELGRLRIGLNLTELTPGVILAEVPKLDRFLESRTLIILDPILGTIGTVATAGLAAFSAINVVNMLQRTLRDNIETREKANKYLEGDAKEQSELRMKEAEDLLIAVEAVARTGETQELPPKLERKLKKHFEAEQQDVKEFKEFSKQVRRLKRSAGKNAYPTYVATRENPYVKLAMRSYASNYYGAVATKMSISEIVAALGIATDFEPLIRIGDLAAIVATPAGEAFFILEPWVAAVGAVATSLAGISAAVAATKVSADIAMYMDRKRQVIQYAHAKPDRQEQMRMRQAEHFIAILDDIGDKPLPPELRDEITTFFEEEARTAREYNKLIKKMRRMRRNVRRKRNDE